MKPPLGIGGIHSVHLKVSHKQSDIYGFPRLDFFLEQGAVDRSLQPQVLFHLVLRFKFHYPGHLFPIVTSPALDEQQQIQLVVATFVFFGKVIGRIVNKTL